MRFTSYCMIPRVEIARTEHLELRSTTTGSFVGNEDGALVEQTYIGQHGTRFKDCLAELRAEFAREDHLEFRSSMMHPPKKDTFGVLMTDFNDHRVKFKKCMEEIESTRLDFKHCLAKLNSESLDRKTNIQRCVKGDSVDPSQEVLNCFPAVEPERKEVVRDYLDQLHEQVNNVEISPANLNILKSKLSAEGNFIVDNLSREEILELEDIIAALKLKSQSLSPQEIVKSMPEDFTISCVNNLEATGDCINALTYLEQQPEFIASICFQPKVVLLIGFTQFLHWYGVFEIKNVFTEMVRKIKYVMREKIAVLTAETRIRTYKSLKLLTNTLSFASMGVLFYSIFQPAVDSWFSNCFIAVKNSFSAGQTKPILGSTDISISINQKINRDSGINSSKGEDFLLKDIEDHSKTFELTGSSGLKELSKDENYLVPDAIEKNSNSDVLIDFKKVYNSPNPSKEINRIFFNLGRKVGGILDQFLISPTWSFLKGGITEICERHFGKSDINVSPKVADLSVSEITTNPLTRKSAGLIFGAGKLAAVGGATTELTSSYFYTKVLAQPVSEKTNENLKSEVNSDKIKQKIIRIYDIKSK